MYKNPSIIFTIQSHLHKRRKKLSNHITLSFYLPISQWLKTLGSHFILVTYIMHTIYYCCFIPVNNRMLMGKLYYQPCCLRSNTFCKSRLRLKFLIIGALIESICFRDNHFSKAMKTYGNYKI